MFLPFTVINTVHAVHQIITSTLHDTHVNNTSTVTVTVHYTRCGLWAIISQLTSEGLTVVWLPFTGATDPGYIANRFGALEVGLTAIKGVDRISHQLNTVGK